MQVKKASNFANLTIASLVKSSYSHHIIGIILFTPDVNTEGKKSAIIKMETNENFIRC